MHIASKHRFKGSIYYKGTHYAGWQRQMNQVSVQHWIEQALSTFYRQEVQVVGCGRTDAGVHARNYVLHFDLMYSRATVADLYGINAILPGDISFFDIQPVAEDFHARYDCRLRTYRYYLHRTKDPFIHEVSYACPFIDKVALDRLNEAAYILLQWEDFYPFCKSNSGVEHYKCRIENAFWIQRGNQWVFEISANRFLRGMVRLIVGMCLDVARGRIRLDEVKTALRQQRRLEKPWSAPAHGLFLEAVTYPGV